MARAGVLAEKLVESKLASGFMLRLVYDLTPAAARISAGTEQLNRGHGLPVDQRAMSMIDAQLQSDRSVREWSTAELIEKINELRPYEA